MKAKTLAIVKPDGVRRNLTGECIRRLQKKNLKLIDIRICQLTQTKAKQLYKDIKKKHPRIYLPLIEYMTSGQIVILILEGKKAAAKARKIAGPIISTGSAQRFNKQRFDRISRNSGSFQLTEFSSV